MQKFYLAIDIGASSGRHILVQMLHEKEFADLQEARNAIKHLFPIQEFLS